MPVRRVALTDDGLGQGELMRRRACRVRPPRSAFAGSPQAVQTLGTVAAQPRVIQLAADAEVATGHRDVAGNLLDVAHTASRRRTARSLSGSLTGLLTI